MGSKAAAGGCRAPAVWDAERTCSICLEKFAAGQLARSLPCSHIFHAECIDPWLRQARTCPHCRHNVNHSDVPGSSKSRQPARPSNPFDMDFARQLPRELRALAEAEAEEAMLFEAWLDDLEGQAVRRGNARNEHAAPEVTVVGATNHQRRGWPRLRKLLRGFGSGPPTFEQTLRNGPAPMNGVLTVAQAEAMRRERQAREREFRDLQRSRSLAPPPSSRFYLGH